MKKAALLTILLLALGLILYTPGCSSSHKSSRGSSPSAGTGGGTTGTGTTTGGGGSNGGGSGDEPSVQDCATATAGGDNATPDSCPTISSRQEMFDWINQSRQDYSFHGRNPDPGAGWPLTMSWDDGLADQAQNRAVELAGGSSSQGKALSFMLGNLHPGETMWVTEGGNYHVEAKSDPESAANAHYGGGSGKWHEHHNSAFRMYIAYYDGQAGSPAMTKLGVGAAKASDGGVWWVLQFGP
ncbi:MAG: hypothetical protein E3J72_07565 [Planctomycetota bacterium]|nr:MAG: hypothetical protein E3J72_07565 [Planctomycetota bacterium]